MAYDIRRAALVICCLFALLLAASLMPAIGLGTFESQRDGTFGGGSGGFGSGGESGPSNPSSDVTTATDSDSESETDAADDSEQADERQSTTTAAVDEQDDEASDSTDDAGGENAGAILGLGVVGIILGLVGGVFAAGISYGGLVFVGGAIFGYDRISFLPFSASFRTLPQLTMSTLIGGSSVTVSFLDQLSTTVGEIGTGLSAVLSIPFSVADAGASALGGLFAASRGFSLGLGSLFGSMSGALLNLSIGFGTRGERSSGADTTTDAREAGGPQPEVASEPDEDAPPASVTEAWEEMVDALLSRRSQTMTPTEIASAAIERGWPAGPVERLTGLFQEIRYGGRAETTERTDSAVSAYNRLRQFWRDS